MFILSRLGLLGMAVALSLPATTLEQLSLDEMAVKSTGIVRAKVTGSYAAGRGTNIYTFYKLDVSETLKGTPAKSLEVAVVGGSLRGVRQMIAGTPVLNAGEDYLLFLWTSRSGLTQVIGLAQGVFTVKLDASGNLTAARASLGESMVDVSGKTVEDRGIAMPLNEMRRRVGSALGDRPGVTQ